MGRHWKRATEWAVVGTPAGAGAAGVSRVAGWEARAALSIGAAVAHWLGADGGRVSSHRLGTIARAEKGSRSGCAGR
jgi:hypothetical protein